MPAVECSASAGLVPRPDRRYWQKRRFWAAAVVFCSGISAAAVAWQRGQQTRLIFINAGAESLAPCTAAVAGQGHYVPVLAPEASHRWVLSPYGQTSAVTLRGLRTDGSEWTWEGSSLTPGDGHRLILRISADGSVEPGDSLSVWRELLGD